jgi:hypothetical protein
VGDILEFPDKLSGVQAAARQHDIPDTRRQYLSGFFFVFRRVRGMGLRKVSF